MALVDARPKLQAGGEPFEAIVTAADLATGEELVLLAPARSPGRPSSAQVERVGARPGKMAAVDPRLAPPRRWGPARRNLEPPALVVAADHRARGVLTVERYATYVAALRAALPACDGILASTQPLRDLAAAGALQDRHRTYLSLNRSGLAGMTGELDDRLVTTVAQAARGGWTGVKHMTRFDLGDPLTSAALELLGRVLEEAEQAGLEAMVEAAPWRDGRMDHDAAAIVRAAVIAHDIGAPLLKVPMPDAPAGAARADAVARIVASVGVPVLFLGGPRSGTDDELAALVGDAMAGGAAGMAVGRAIYEAPDPAATATMVADLVHGRAPHG